MGDDCNVVARRHDDEKDSSSFSFSTNVTACIKDIEDLRVTDGRKVNERNCLLPDEKSEEMEDYKRKFVENQEIMENNSLELLKLRDEIAADEPVVFVPETAQPALFPFPYSGTKLRPEAPPFTLESLKGIINVSPFSGYEISDEINTDSASGEPIFVRELRNQEEHSCFVNIELKSPMEIGPSLVSSIQQHSNCVIVPLEPKSLPEMKNSQMRDFKEMIKNPGLKPFSLTSTPLFKRSQPKVRLSIESLPINVQIGDRTNAVDVESVANEPNALREMDREIEESRVVGGNWRTVKTFFLLGGRIQIAVLITSFVVSALLLIYVLV